MPFDVDEHRIRKVLCRRFQVDITGSILPGSSPPENLGAILRLDRLLTQVDLKAQAVTSGGSAENRNHACDEQNPMEALNQFECSIRCSLGASQKPLMQE